MRVLSDIIKGAVIGVANIIPGVSGGTMAVSLGIYDRLIYAISDLFHHFKKSLGVLIPVLGGMAAGIVFFAYGVEFLLDRFALPTCLAFLGLILGGVPMLWRNLKQSIASTGKGWTGGVLAFVVLLAISVALPLLSANTGEAASTALPVWFLIGVIASATMVIPGVSGSMVLMILGYYYAVLGQLTSFFEALRRFDLGEAIPLAIPLFFFGVGVLLGIFLIAKGIRFLLERMPGATYGGILGLVVGSPVSMLYKTGALAEVGLPSGGVRVVVGILLLGLCFAAIFWMDRRSLQAKQNGN